MQGSEQLLEFRVRDDRKIVKIWLANAEKGDVQLKELLKLVMERYKAKKYTVVIFESGVQERVDVIAGLLAIIVGGLRSLR